MEKFWDGFVKGAEAKEGPEGHHIRRMFLGNPISSAIEAKKGKKMQAFGHAYGHHLAETGKGLGVGALAGGAAGLLASAVTKGRIAPHRGAGIGALGGGYLGAAAGALKGNHGAEASNIHGKYSK